MSEKQKNTPPAQQQDNQPGIESKMEPKPKYLRNNYNGSHKLQNKIAVNGQIIHVNGGTIINN